MCHGILLIVFCVLSNILLLNASTETSFINEIDTFPANKTVSLQELIYQSRQIGLPSDPLGVVTNTIPCKCDAGICNCCTGELLRSIGMKGCLELVYHPEDFAFELKMKMNDLVLYNNKVSGKNPPPICVRSPRYNWVKLCLTFYDIYFFGQNMHVCIDIGGYFQGFELFSRSFDCIRMGNQGIKFVKPETAYPGPANDAIIDQGSADEIEDYDENVVRSLSVKN